jgi:hypothetical protein
MKLALIFVKCLLIALIIVAFFFFFIFKVEYKCYPIYVAVACFILSTNIDCFVYDKWGKD